MNPHKKCSRIEFHAMQVPKPRIVQSNCENTQYCHNQEQSLLLLSVLSSPLFYPIPQSMSHGFGSCGEYVILSTKLTTTASSKMMARNVGPKRSSKPAWPLIRILFALQ